MTWARSATGSYVYTDASATGITPTLSGYSTGDLLLVISGEFIGSDTISDPGGWTRLSPNSSAKQVAIWGKLAASTSDTLPTITWPSHGGWVIALGYSGAPATLTGITDGSSDRQSTSTSIISQTGASFTPTGNNRLILNVGNFVKTSARDGATITAASSFTTIASLVRAGNVAAATVAEWIQTTAASVSTAGASTSSSESVAQNYEGIKLALIAGTGGSNLLLPSGFRGGMIDLTGGF